MMTNDEPGDGTMVLLGGCQLDEVELGCCVGCVVDDDEDRWVHIPINGEVK